MLSLMINIPAALLTNWFFLGGCMGGDRRWGHYLVPYCKLPETIWKMMLKSYKMLAILRKIFFHCRYKYLVCFSLSKKVKLGKTSAVA